MRDLVILLSPDCALGGKRTDAQCAGLLGWHPGKPRWNAVEAAQRAHCEYLYEQCGLSPDCASGEQAK